jgi:hypothetical protein
VFAGLVLQVEQRVAYGYVRRRFGPPGPENQRLGATVIAAARAA